MAFKEGDRVVWEKKPDEKWKVHYLWNSEFIQIIRHERGGFASLRVPISEIKPFDRYSEIKQAVREVLLSEEFLLAFGKAIANAPIPSAIICEPRDFGTAVKLYSDEVKKYER